MKTKLSDFTVNEFIELMTGDFRIIGEDGPTITRNIILEYREIVEPGGLRGFLYDGEEYSKAKSMVVFFTICNTLIELKFYDRVREILSEYGMSVERMSDSRLKAEMSGKLAKARNELEKLEAEKAELPKDIDFRKDFDEQTAALMAHFKFQIDTATMKATLYAHLVARFHREIKAQQKAMEKMK